MSIEPRSARRPSRADGRTPAPPAGSKEPAGEAWALMTELFFTDGKPRFVAIAQEFDLAPMQLHALRILEPGAEQPMSALAGTLGCDASNVTGIVDRLATRGLIERRDAPEDRRVRLIALTAEGERLREHVLERFRVPPAPISSLSVEDQRELRDLLRRALGQGERG